MARDDSFQLGSACMLNTKEIVRFVNDVFADYPIPIRWRKDEFPLDLKENSIDLSLSKIALMNEELVGLLLLCNRHPISRIDVMGVRRHFRGKGIGSLLLESVLEEGRKKGFKEMILEVISTDLEVIRFYAKHGFRKRRRLLSYMMKIERYEKPNISVVPMNFEETFQKVINFDEKRNWQRSLESIRLSKGRYNYSSFFDKSGEGYVIWGINEEGGIFVVDIGGREVCYNDMLKRVFMYLAFQNNARYITMMNLPEDNFLIPLLKEMNAVELFSQYEMCITL